MKNAQADGRTVAELSTSGFGPAEGIANLREARRIIAGYTVTDLDEQGQEELSLVLADSFASHVTAKAMEKVLSKFMRGKKKAKTEDYLRLAAFTAAVPVITKNKALVSNVADIKGINNKFLVDCAKALIAYQPTEEYENADMRGKVLILEAAIQPMLLGYMARMPNRGHDMAV